MHSRAGLYNKRGEFPSPRENEYRISPDALRYYKSGKSFLYRYMPFQLASLLNRVVVVFVPMLLILIPSVRSIPKIYRWHMRLRIIRWYRALMVLEKSMAAGPIQADQGEEIKRQLEHIERAVNKMKVPASFADQFYGLRVNIDFVRKKLTEVSPGAQGACREVSESVNRESELRINEGQELRSCRSGHFKFSQLPRAPGENSLRQALSSSVHFGNSACGLRQSEMLHPRARSPG